MISLLIADDEPLVRMGLRAVVDREHDVRVVGEAHDGASAVDMAARLRPDIVMLDVRMPGMNGLQALRRITADESLRDTRVIIVTTFEVDDYIVEALDAGASGFLLKDTAPADMVGAIRTVHGGHALLSPAVTSRLIALFEQRSRETVVDIEGVRELTARETEVLGWVAEGLSNEEIGAQLFLSPATVRTHVGRAMVKLSARDRAQLVVYALRAGVRVDPGSGLT